MYLILTESLQSVYTVSNPYRIPLLAFGQHNDDRDALFPGHSPEVIDGARQGALAGDVFTLIGVPLEKKG